MSGRHRMTPTDRATLIDILYAYAITLVICWGSLALMFWVVTP